MHKFKSELTSDKAQRLVLAAVDAIHEKGLDQVKLTDVAKQAGVTTGAVTYYFEGKEALLIAAFYYSCDAILEKMQSLGAGTLINRSLLVLPTTSKNRRLWSVWLAFSVRAQTSAKLRKVYQDYYAAVESVIANLSEIADPDKAAQVAGKVVAVIDGIGLCASVNPNQWPAKRQRSTLIDLLNPILGP